MTILLYTALLVSAVNAYAPAPRWGQATSLLLSSLFVSGGKQDDTNSFSYSGANAQSDLLLLPLGVSFSIDNPPWAIVSDPVNATNSHGPAVAWHTLSAYNSSKLLLFGGVPTPVVPLATQPDSALLLDVYNRRMPQFTEEPPNWGGEPIRRIHHTAVTSRSGQVYIFGGEKADDSRIPYSEHYVFDPAAETFTLLPAGDAAPPALTGHGSVILPNGQIFVFGGLATSGLLTFDTFYIFDTVANSWSTQTSSSTSLPAPRRAFAHTLIDDSAILIHGGGSRDLLESFGDGWIYNITTATWTAVPPLSAIGQRRDHFCVYSGSVVLFGFGYGTNSAANTSLILYDPITQSFPTTYNPPTVASITLPVASQTDTATATSHAFSGTLSDTVRPTSTLGSGGGGNGGGNGNGGGKSPVKKATAIAVGTVVGLLAFVAAGLAVVWYIRRHERKRYLEGGVGGIFSPLDGDGGPKPARMVDATPQEPTGVVGTIGAAVGSWAGWIAGGLGLAATGAAVAQDRKERRDMLADEDTRDFGYGGWYDAGDGRSTRSRLERLRQGSGGSTWSLMSVFRPKARRQESAASGLSFGSRGESLLGHGDEKDPFSGDDTYMRNVASSSRRPGPGRRQSSYASYTSYDSNHLYNDPFSDPVAASELDITAPGALLSLGRTEALSPISEARSSGASNSGSSTGHHTSSASIISPFDSLSRASTFAMSSTSHTNSPFGGPSSPIPGPSRPTQQPRASSILDMRPAVPDQPMRRSDTWWARFANKSMLDRRSSHKSNAGPMEFRDPAPLPARLGFVQEETASLMAERKSSDGSSKERHAQNASHNRGAPYGRMSTHGKSMSSIQTADSAALERMGDVGVVLRGNRQTGSTSTRGSETTHGGGSVDEGVRTSWYPPEQEVVYTSPVEMVPASSFNLPTTPPAMRRSVSPTSSKQPPSAPASVRPPLSTASSGGSSASAVSGGSASSVADRVRAYERRMSQDVTTTTPSSPPPKDKDHARERRKSNTYGLVPRPSLFVANPGPNRDGSQDA